jgi:hypothetical protein
MATITRAGCLIVYLNPHACPSRVHRVVRCSGSSPVFRRQATVARFDLP